ncbi:anthrone oxygenase family protein [Nocardioides sp. C4-1]|uniref:anthrone oxygenase family protein n=1 Tax=Nocardioides sp. C4-1 TaxID=3151851 RepID=UPI0032645375
MVEALENLRTPLLLLAVLANGLQAGTYYTWASGVLPGLARTDDRTFVHALQQTNAAIVNPVFLATFVGAPLLAGLGVLAVDGSARAWAVAGLVLAVATVVVTVAGNVPLNDALAAAGPVDGITDLAGVREAFEGPWVRWNVVRTLTSTGALGCLAVAMAR